MIPPRQRQNLQKEKFVKSHPLITRKPPSCINKA